jgi:AcrR family transcriptional regulator
MPPARVNPVEVDARDVDVDMVGRPGQGRELRARGKRTLQRLLDAGAEVFAERGVHAARVDDIVKLAKTSHGTFYLYFSNKEDLFRSLATDVANRMFDLANEMGPISAGPEGYDQLHAWLEQFGELYLKYGAVIQAWTETETSGTNFGRLGTDVLSEFSRVLAGRIAEIGSADVDPQVAALALIAMFERSNYYVVSNKMRIEPSAMLDTLAAVTHASLFGAGANTPAS